MIRSIARGRAGIGRECTRFRVLFNLNGRMLDLEFGVQAFTDLLQKHVATGYVRHFQVNS